MTAPDKDAPEPILVGDEDQHVRLHFRRVNGAVCIDLRVFERAPRHDAFLPTDKGFAVRVEHVPGLIQLLWNAIDGFMKVTEKLDDGSFQHN